MRFNGTTVPTHRDDTYTTKETNRDIQTGRAVYADKDKYESDVDYKADIDKYVSEGFHPIFSSSDESSEDGESGGGSGGGNEPLILTSVEDGDDIRLDKTFGEIKDAFNNGRSIWYSQSVEGGHAYSPIVTIFIPLTGGGGSVEVSLDYRYVTHSDSDYPIGLR